MPRLSIKLLLSALVMIKLCPGVLLRLTGIWSNVNAADIAPYLEALSLTVASSF